MVSKTPDQSDERIFVRRSIIVIALVATALMLWMLRGVALMLFGAVVVATIFRSLADLFRKYLKLPDWLAVGAAVALVFGLLGLFGFLFGSEISEQVRQLSATLPNAWKSFEARVTEMGFGQALQQATSAGSSSFVNVGRTLMSVTSGLADLIVVIFGGIFLAAQPAFYRTGALKLFPAARRDLVSEAMGESDRALRLWLKGQLIAMVIVGLATGIGLWLLGVPSAFVLGLLAGLLEFIPFAGPIIAAIPAVLIALAASPDLALWVVLLYTAVQQAEGVVVQPLVQQYAVDLPGVVLLFALIAFGSLFGAIGVLLAAPLAVVSYVLVKRLYVREALDTPTPIPGTDKA